MLDEHKKLQKLNSSQPTKLSKINKKDMPLHKMIAKLRGPPIIVCSAGSLDVFNMLNVYDFLQYERYIPVQTKKAEKKTKQRSFIIQQQVDGNMLEFQVVDSVRRFTAADWYTLLANYVFYVGLGVESLRCWYLAKAGSLKVGSGNSPYSYLIKVSTYIKCSN